MDELQQKRQKEMLLRTETYKEALGEDSLIKNMGVMDMNFDAYDNKRLDENACALFRERLKEMIMIDDIAAEEMKAKYPDIFEEAMNEKVRLNTQASRTGVSKAVTDITGSKKAHAKEKMDQMSKANKLIVDKNKEESIKKLTDLSKKANDAFSDANKKLKLRIQDDFSTLTEEDMQQRVDEINKAHFDSEITYQTGQKKTIIANNLKKEGRSQEEIDKVLADTKLTEEEIEQVRIKVYGGEITVDGKTTTIEGSSIHSLNDAQKLTLVRDKKLKAVDTDDRYKTTEEKEKRKEEITTEYKRLDSQLQRYEKVESKGGPFYAKDAMFFEKDYVIQIDKFTNRVENELKQYHGKLGFSDIERDVARWSSPLNCANEATIEDCEQAFKHISDLVIYRDVNAFEARLADEFKILTDEEQKGLSELQKLDLVRDKKIKAVDSDDRYKPPKEKEETKEEMEKRKKEIEKRKEEIRSEYKDKKEKLEIQLKEFEKDRTPEAKAKEKKAAREGLEYGIGRLELFEYEGKELLKGLPSSLFGPRPLYGDLIENADLLNELYRKSQALMNVGRLIARSPHLVDLVGEGKMTSFKRTFSFVVALGANSGILVNRGKKLDERMREEMKKGKKPEEVKDPLPPMQTLEEKYMEVFSRFASGKV